MPKNEEFSFHVLLGGAPVVEYEKDGQYMVLTNLMHDTTYKEERRELVDDRIERQEIPCTPYQVALTLISPMLHNAWAKLFVDGVLVTNILLRNGEERVVKGFHDGDETREFLFTLPRFGRDSSDRIEKDRISKVGCISVELFEAFFKYNEMRKRSRGGSLDFMQATKKDTTEVTNGEYTMATTKAGRFVEKDEKPGSKRKYSDSFKQVRIFGWGKALSKLEVKYHMRHTLDEMGIKVLD